MSSKTKKNVGFERDTKPSKHHHRSSRDSGVGSSSASDRASLGTAPDDSAFSYQQVEDQRQRPSALREALDAAYEKIRQLERDNAKLNSALTDSNKENRLLKREKGELLNQLDDANDTMDHQKKVIKELSREGSSSPKRSGEKSSSTSTRSSTREEKRSSTSGRRSSWREQPAQLYEHRHSPPLAPQPLSTTPNPFAPRGAPLPAATYPPPGPVAYATTSLQYAPGPTFHPQSPMRERFADGRYHLTPL